MTQAADKTPTEPSTDPKPPAKRSRKQVPKKLLHVGRREIALICDAPVATVEMWGFRGEQLRKKARVDQHTEPMPLPDATIDGRPVWDREKVILWAGRTGRLRPKWARDEYEKYAGEPPPALTPVLKMSDVQVRKARREGMTPKEIAEKYGVSHAYACRLVQGVVRKGIQ
jgi:hypothetical protein